jgi:multiple sugar transport system ATP-binding protein
MARRSAPRSARRACPTGCAPASPPARTGQDVIVGLRPEHFEDARIVGADAPDRMRFRAKAAVVESMGSEKYVYVDVNAQALHTADLDALAADAGMEDLPSHGGATQVVARVSADSRVVAGNEIELAFETAHLQLFADDGRRLLEPGAPR